MSVRIATENNEIGNRPLRRFLLALFALSGAAGLVYEVVWVRELTLVLGASTYAVTIILAAFMSGLGIGSWLIGKHADRLNGHELAKCYVYLEIGIAAYALSLPLVLSLQEHLFAALYQHGSAAVSNSLKLVLAFLFFVFPSCLMGATLPVLSRYIIRTRSRISIGISRLYAVNTFGAMFGTVLAGYVMLPRLGNSLTNMSAALANFGVAGAFWMVHRTISSAPDGDLAGPPVTGAGPVRDEKMSSVQRATVWAFAISGVAAMFYEVAWTRTLSMILGTTTFAFSTMLATFLLGIALGSACYGLIRKLAPPAILFVGLEYIVAFSVLLTIPLFARLPFLYLSLYDDIVNNWWSVQIIRFILASLVMMVPTLALGCILPVVSDILVDRTGSLGAKLGRAYGFNTFGAVIGTCLAGLVLVPALGMQSTIIIGSIVSLIAGSLVCLLRTDAAMKHRVIPCICILPVLLVFIGVMNPWSPKVMSSGVYVYTDRYLDVLDRVESATARNDVVDASPWDIWKQAMKQYSMLYYNTGKTATVSVMERDDGVRFLTVDGKTDASTGGGHDMKTQVLLGQLPLLFDGDPDKVFVVGMGSGVTVGSVLTHDVRVVDCAEFSNSVVEAAEYFSTVNHKALEDRRLRIIPRDARNVLLTSSRDYDAIISQPSNPWISGQSSLFSLEWYQIVRNHLMDGGIFAQWVPAYQMAKRDVRIIIHTLRSVFPHVTAWTSGSSGELILLAKKGTPLRFSYTRFQERVAASRVRDDINRLGFDPELLPFATFAMNEQDIGVYLYAGLERPVRRNTDNLLITEFSTPKQMVEQHVVRRFTESDHLHGDIESLMEILTDVNVEDIMEVLES